MYILGKVGPQVGSGRVGLFVGNLGSGRVRSGQRFAGSGRVQEKWPVDNSGPPPEPSDILKRFHSLYDGQIMLL